MEMGMEAPRAWMRAGDEKISHYWWYLPGRDRFDGEELGWYARELYHELCRYAQDWTWAYLEEMELCVACGKMNAWCTCVPVEDELRRVAILLGQYPGAPGRIIEVGEVHGTWTIAGQSRQATVEILVGDAIQAMARQTLGDVEACFHSARSFVEDRQFFEEDRAREAGRAADATVRARRERRATEPDGQ